MSCPACPCPGACLGWPAFCAWAAESPADPVKLLHIRARSGLPAPAPSAGPADPPDGRTMAESLALTRRMNDCPYRSRDAACGCSGGRCALRGGAAVSHLDCFDCLERYP